jgi:Cytochrome P460
VDAGAPLEARALESNHYLASLNCKVTSMISTKHVLFLGYAAVGSFVLATLAADAPQDARIRPNYTEKGLLEVPQRFRSWVFVGADLSPRYKSEAAETLRAKNATGQRKPDEAFHAVYINPESYDSFLKTGQFPDPTILVMEVFKAEEKDIGGVLASGQFQGKRIELAAAVKDRNRPGGGVPWAYYSFDLNKDSNPGQPARAFPDANCYDCHLRHASKDNVWIQFYPALRDRE